MKALRFLLLVCALPFALASHAAESLLVFAGAATVPPTTEAARAFERKTGAKVDVVFGGSGYVLAQMKLAKQGDLYFPGSSDYMEIAKREGYVLPETEKIIVYVVPAINVQKGNPHRIKGLKDLLKPGLRVAIANPEGVCVGAYAVEIFEKELTPAEREQLKANIRNYTGSCEQTATAISLKLADAVIGWRVFQYWDPDRIETLPLPKEQITRIGYIPIAISKFSKNPKLAQQFIDFVTGPEGQAIYARYSYFADPESAFRWIGAVKPVGGEYVVPKEWLKLRATVDPKKAVRP
ncbi:molybdate transport system substrate-binding protein [Sulfuritortus calidifontis]|uniref:Molybdate transport system substrate-binding protein n=1 Tax=Sulfuritortus calidifontis TaxID=1914471 RepID=A0A4R3JZS8_9PROT|nr:molybdate ABC transporter substrate-binding protein [Sulfuritortus calidifontis]TCS73089.1 molybdate transport system substrate-binding protein [Sulfuritortus calidifontis]